jgi:FkbM family methyltransferase
MKGLALLTARVAGFVLRAVPGQGRSVPMSRLVNLFGRALWEMGMRRAPRGTNFRRRLKSGALVELDLAERIQGQTALTGIYEWTLADEIARHLPPHGTFFDVGGNVGLVTMEVLGRTSDRPIDVHAFEPHPENIGALRRNLELNRDAHVQIVAAAVGNRIGSAALGVSANEHESGSHRVGSEHDGGSPIADTMTVQMTTLDDYTREHGIERVDVLKVDVEGLEAEVLEGARELLSGQRVGLIILEMSDSGSDATGGDSRNLHDTLAAYGYKATPIASTSPTRLFPWMHHLAHQDVAFSPGPRQSQAQSSANDSRRDRAILPTVSGE